MSQDLRQISIDQFRLEIFKLTVSQLKQLIEGVYEFKRTINNPINADVLDLERKESIIESELMRRGYFKPKANPNEVIDYNQWKRKMFKRKLF